MRVGRHVLGLALIAVLSGCGITAQGDAVRYAVAAKGAEIADEGVSDAVWFLCNAATVGSIKRRFGRTASGAVTYNNLCNADAQLVAPIFPPLEENDGSGQ